LNFHTRLNPIRSGAHYIVSSPERVRLLICDSGCSTALSSVSSLKVWTAGLGGVKAVQAWGKGELWKHYR